MWLPNSYDPRSFSPISWAPGDESGVPESDLNKEFWAAMMAAGAAGSNGPRAPQRDYLSENLLRQQQARDSKTADEYNRAKLELDDRLATEFIVALVHLELLDG